MFPKPFWQLRSLFHCVGNRRTLQGKSKPQGFAAFWNSRMVWIWRDTSTFLPVLQQRGSTLMDLIKYKKLGIWFINGGKVMDVRGSDTRNSGFWEISLPESESPSQLVFLWSLGDGCAHPLILPPCQGWGWRLRVECHLERFLSLCLKKNTGEKKKPRKKKKREKKANNKKTPQTHTASSPPPSWVEGDIKNRFWGKVLPSVTSGPQMGTFQLQDTSAPHKAKLNSELTNTPSFLQIMWKKN